MRSGESPSSSPAIRNAPNLIRTLTISVLRKSFVAYSKALSLPSLEACEEAFVRLDGPAHEPGSHRASCGTG